MFADFYRKYVLSCLVIIGIQLINSGPDMPLLLLKAPTDNSGRFSPTRITSCEFISYADLRLTI
jgi:hypothetical protein